VTTWTAQPEPDPKVAAVRDRHGVRWRRDAGPWWGDIGHDYEDYRTWTEILARGPLTDASADHR